jgi:hypothetical protein
VWRWERWALRSLLPTPYVQNSRLMKTQRRGLINEAFQDDGGVLPDKFRGRRRVLAPPRRRPAPTFPSAPNQSNVSLWIG